MRQDVRVARTNWLFGGRRAWPLANGGGEHMHTAAVVASTTLIGRRPSKDRPPPNLHRRLCPRRRVERQV
jgi:hypothetical protein